MNSAKALSPTNLSANSVSSAMPGLAPIKINFCIRLRMNQLASEELNVHPWSNLIGQLVG
jgi:hypothetical protein